MDERVCDTCGVPPGVRAARGPTAPRTPVTCPPLTSTWPTATSERRGSKAASHGLWYVSTELVEFSPKLEEPSGL